MQALNQAGQAERSWNLIEFAGEHEPADGRIGAGAGGAPGSPNAGVVAWIWVCSNTTLNMI